MARLPYIFIFSGLSGSKYGYNDRWENDNIFSYTGEGQSGHMQFVKGNLALRDHVKSGKRVFLFEYTSKGYVKYVTELEFFDADFFETIDKDSNIRVGIKFFFKRKGAYIGIDRSALSAVAPIVGPSLSLNTPNETERKGLVISRVGQGAYRKSILHRWNYHCAVTRFNKLDILIASHIVSWKDSNNQERLDVHNGILLSPTYDALFDKHFISFEDNGKIILTDKIEVSAFHKIGVTGKERIDDLSSYNYEYLKRHREIVYS